MGADDPKRRFGRAVVEDVVAVVVVVVVVVGDEKTDRAEATAGSSRWGDVCKKQINH